MSTASQPLPAANVTELAAAQAFATTGIQEIPVFMGPCGGTYAVNTPVLFSAGDIATMQTIFPNGPVVKETALAVVDVAQPFAVMRMTTATVGTLLTTPVVVKNVSSTFLSTLAGTALDGGDIVIKFGVVGGNTGTGPIAYSVSTNGGGSFGTTLALGTATTIVVLGVTVTLGSAKVVTANDTIAWTQWAPSSTVLPLTTSGAGASGAYQGTSVISTTGSPLDLYEVAWRVIDDGSAGAGTTIGTLGTLGPIKFEYTLDYLSESPTWSQAQSLGTASTFLLLDGPISSASTGVTLAFAAGNLFTGDQVAFRTSPPTYDAAGLTAAGAALTAAFNTGVLQWTWVRAVGPVPEAIAADADAIALAWEGSGPTTGCQPAWIAVDALDRAGATQTLLSWSAYLQAQYAPYTSTHCAVTAGMLRGFDPINGRSNRRSNFAFAVARAMGASGTNISTDWGQFDLGALNASVTMIDASGAANEHDANTDPTLQAMGFITSRHWPGELGVFPTKASLLGPVNDIQRVPLRRVMNLAKKLERRGLKLACVKTFRQWTAQAGPDKTPNVKTFPPGNVYEPDAIRIEGIINDLLTRGVLNFGYVSAINFVLNRIPTSNGGGSYSLSGAMQEVALLYVDIANGTAQFVSAEG